jgi:hypothetical protein
MPTGDDMLSSARVIERIEHIQVTFARHGEDLSRVVCAQALDDRIGNPSHRSVLLWKVTNNNR